MIEQGYRLMDNAIEGCLDERSQPCSSFRCVLPMDISKLCMKSWEESIKAGFEISGTEGLHQFMGFSGFGLTVPHNISQHTNRRR